MRQQRLHERGADLAERLQSEVGSRYQFGIAADYHDCTLRPLRVHIDERRGQSSSRPIGDASRRASGTPSRGSGRGCPRLLCPRLGDGRDVTDRRACAVHRRRCGELEELGLVTATVPSSRGEAAALLLDVLAAACPAGDVCLIGSMAQPGTSDAFSDIDIRWSIPSGQTAEQLQSLRFTLERVGRVESLRVDPEERPDSRLVFVRFQGWPLWWRVDLEIHSAGSGSLGVHASDPWSPHESACMGIIVTLKALARNRPEMAEGLMVRALQRVDAPDVDGNWQLRIGTLLDHIATDSPRTADLVFRTRRLSREVFGE